MWPPRLLRIYVHQSVVNLNYAVMTVAWVSSWRATEWCSSTFLYFNMNRKTFLHSLIFLLDDISLFSVAPQIILPIWPPPAYNFRRINNGPVREGFKTVSWSSEDSAFALHLFASNSNNGAIVSRVQHRTWWFSCNQPDYLNLRIWLNITTNGLVVWFVCIKAYYFNSALLITYFSIERSSVHR